MSYPASGPTLGRCCAFERAPAVPIQESGSSSSNVPSCMCMCRLASPSAESRSSLTRVSADSERSRCAARSCSAAQALCSRAAPLLLFSSCRASNVRTWKQMRFLELRPGLVREDARLWAARLEFYPFKRTRLVNDMSLTTRHYGYRSRRSPRPPSLISLDNKQNTRNDTST